MTILGFHIIDIAVVVVYLCVMIYIGNLVSKNIKGQTDFFLAGRKLGKVIQFFLNFGQMTDANSAASVSSFVFRGGIAGVWMGLQTLFMTPYYWFMYCWFRRVRLITMGELFTDRFGGKSLAIIYAIYGILFSALAVGSGYLISLRVMEAMMIKPVSEYSQEDINISDMYAEYTELDNLYRSGQMRNESRGRYETLSSLKNKGHILPYVSYLNENWFYVIYSLIIGVYIVLGGFEAAALTDAVQGILIIVFSVILIPFGLTKIGGFSGLHEQVPSAMLSMFGDITTGEFTWYSVMAILLVSWVQIHGTTSNMSVAGSAKDEMAARVGAVTGGFCKRFMLIAWGFCGLLAYGLFRDTITNPDNTWGVLTKGLLGPGAVGLMLAGILAANMSSLDARALQISALFVRHVYQPIFPNRSEKEYVLAGRIAIVLTLVTGIIVAKYTQSILALMKFMLGAGVTFGAPVLLIFIWRRLTKSAVIIQVITCLVMFFLLPLTLPLTRFVSQNTALMLRTDPKVVTGSTYATPYDVQVGIADNVGELINKEITIAPVSVFFDTVTYSDPYDLTSPLIGKGNFRLELWILSNLGFDFSNYTAAGLLTVIYIFDSVFPFLILIIFSLVTKPTNEQMLKNFYGKMSTPVHSNPEIDLKEVELTISDPHRFDNVKLFPNTQWEFKKWNKVDTIGFVICWIMVVVVLSTFWILINIGK